jgi:hypothetical protein
MTHMPFSSRSRGMRPVARPFRRARIILLTAPAQ